jgi:hypothetical protein
MSGRISQVPATNYLGIFFRDRNGKDQDHFDKCAEIAGLSTLSQSMRAPARKGPCRITWSQDRQSGEHPCRASVYTYSCMLTSNCMLYVDSLRPPRRRLPASSRKSTRSKSPTATAEFSPKPTRSVSLFVRPILPWSQPEAACYLGVRTIVFDVLSCKSSLQRSRWVRVIQGASVLKLTRG